MTRCTVARGRRRPRATVHRVIHSTSWVIVLTVAQKGMKKLLYYPTQRILVIGNISLNLSDADETAI